MQMTDVDRAVQVRAVPWGDPDALALRTAMTAELEPRYAARRAATPVPPQMAVRPDELVFVGVAYLDGRAVGHVALRRVPDASAAPRRDTAAAPDGPADLEIKRMFVDPSVRGAGIGRALLRAAEREALRAGASRVVLQTGDRQPDAVLLYERAGYARIPIFAPYLALPYSLCFAKGLDAAAAAAHDWAAS
jgi:GNAT superfamily N-acetyltransferase